MPANPEKILNRGIDDDEIERLLGQRDLLDATELIARIGHCRWDYPNNRLISCSQGYARIYNLSVDEIIELQSNWERSLAQIHPDDRDAYLEAYQAQREIGNYTVEYRILRNDGETRWLREVGLLKYDDNRNVIDAFGIIQDITELVVPQHDLEDQQELGRQVEAITDIGYFINDEDIDKFLFISPGYARIHGMTVEEFMHHVESAGDNLALVHRGDIERLLAEIEAYIENGDDNFESEYRIVRPNGEVIWVRERSKSRLKKNGRVTLTLGVLQDITEKRSYEQNLQSAKDMLEATVEERTLQLNETVSRLQQEIRERTIVSSELESKNAELERFAYTASHDLKTPLVTIKGFLGLLSRDLDAGDRKRVAEDIEKINQAADTMGRLLEELLELSRIGLVVGDLVTCSLTEIARQAVQLTEARISEMNAVVVIEEMPEVNVDRTRLAEVYQNLVDNALKFMGDQAAPRIHIGASEKDGKRCFYVRDNGIGIAAEYHDLVFGLFERLSREVDGTGVGLALVKRIIEVHGGEVWIESEGPGSGATIFFTLPVS
jgi:PAS domain S-box-containing protein